MPRRALITAVAVFVTGCQTVPDVATPDPVIDPCPPSAASGIESPTPGVALTPDQVLALDVAGVRALGDVYIAWSEYQARRDARAVRIEERVRMTQEWCVAREK